MRKGEPSSQKTGRVKASKPNVESKGTFSSTPNGESAINLSESSMRKNLTKDLDPGLVVQAHFPDKQPAYPLTIFYWTEEKAKSWYKGSDSGQWESFEIPTLSMKQIWRTFLDENALFVKQLSDAGFSEEETYTKFLKAIEGESDTDGLFLYSFDSSFFENLFTKELGNILSSKTKTIIAAEDACKNPTVFEALTRVFGDSNVLKFDEEKIEKKKQEEVDKRLKKVKLGTTPPGIPILELSENEFSFVDINLGSSHSRNLIVKNGGGGSLEATIKTTKPWLHISHAKIHQKDLPLAVTVTVDTSKDKKCNFGFRDIGYLDLGKDIGYIEISYKKAGSVELVRIPVDLSIQTAPSVTPPKVVTFWTTGKKKFVILLLILGIGFLVYSLFLAQSSFTKKIDGALKKGNYFSPLGDNVEEIYKSQLAKSPNSQKLKDAAKRIYAIFTKEGEAAFQRLYADSDDSGWDGITKIYRFLSEIIPEDKEIIARAEFSKAHNILKSRNVNDFSEALKRYHKALELKPNWVFPINGIAKVYILKTSQYYNKDEALVWYNRACEVDPNFPWAYSNIAAIRSEELQWALAEQALQKAVKIKSNRPSFYIDLGNICEKQQKQVEAKNYYQDALKYEKNSERILWLQKKINSFK